MLVLRRKAGESIVIGDGVEICIMEISPTRVKLGVTAPKEISVVRKETIAVANDNRKAAEFLPGSESGGMDVLARLLESLPREIPAAGPKVSAAEADKKGEKDTQGIANTRENPGPA